MRVCMEESQFGKKVEAFIRRPVPFTIYISYFMQLNKLGLGPRFRKGYHWTPGGTLWLLSRLKCWLLAPPFPPPKLKFYAPTLPENKLTPHKNSNFMPPTPPENELLDPK